MRKLVLCVSCETYEQQRMCCVGCVAVRSESATIRRTSPENSLTEYGPLALVSVFVCLLIDSGYGKRGAGGKIPGNAVLVFTLELIEIEKVR